jgi:hypothetical protein
MVRVALALALALTLTACTDDEPAAGPAWGADEPTPVASIDAEPAFADLAADPQVNGAGATCGATAVAPAYDPAELVGEWDYVSSTYVEDGYGYYTEATGTLTMAADGTWAGSRTLVVGAGSGTDPVFPGPGTWRYDGTELTLYYDSGSDPETYTGVLVSDQTDTDGTTFRALTLEQAQGADCVQLLLADED